MAKLTYSAESSRLVSLCAQDQDELKKLSKAYYDHAPKDRLFKLNKAYQVNCAKRTKEALLILKKISQPTLDNIGEEASVALIVLMLHSELANMKIVRDAFINTKEVTVVSALAPLEDKILILEGSKQKFGTQWMEGEDGKPFLYPVQDFDQLNKLRARHGLGPINKPNIISLEDNKSIAAISSDQRMPTNKEMKIFKGDFIDF